MSKVDPRKLNKVSRVMVTVTRLTLVQKVDEHTTLLLEVAKQEPAPKASRELDGNSHSSVLSSPRRHRQMSLRSQVPSTMPLSVSHPVTDVESGANQGLDATLADNESSDTEDAEVIVEKVEQPGLDSLRGTFGTIGTIIRNRRRTALTEAHDRSQTRNRRGSEASGLASQSISEEPPQPGEERDAEKLDLGRKHFGSRKPSEPTLSALFNVPSHDTHPLGTQSILPPPSSNPPIEQPAFHPSPESEKSDPLTSSPRRAPVLHAHFDPNQQSPSSRIQISPPPPSSNNTASVRSRVDQSDQGPKGDEEKSPST